MGRDTSLQDVAQEVDACLGRLPFAMDVDVTALVDIPSHQNLLDADEGRRAPDLPTGWSRRRGELRTLMGMKPKPDPEWCCCGRPSVTCRAVERHDSGGDLSSGAVPQLVICATIFNEDKGLDPMELEAAFFSAVPDAQGRVRASVWSLMHATAQTKRQVQEFLPAAQAAIVLSAGVTALERGIRGALEPLFREFMGYLGEAPGGAAATRSLLEAYVSLPGGPEGASEVDVMARVRLGDMKQREGRFMAAVEEYKAAVAAVMGAPTGEGDRVRNARDNLGTFWINMGTAYMRGGDLAMSEKSIRSCQAWCAEKEGDPNRQRISAMAHYHLGCVYEEMGRHGEAREERMLVFRHVSDVVNVAMDRPRPGAITAVDRAGREHVFDPATQLGPHQEGRQAGPGGGELEKHDMIRRALAVQQGRVAAQQQQQKKQAPSAGGPKCDHCNAGGKDLKLCSGCHAVSYCSRECQKKGWKAHKAACGGLRKRGGAGAT